MALVIVDDCLNCNSTVDWRLKLSADAAAPAEGVLSVLRLLRLLRCESNLDLVGESGEQGSSDEHPRLLRS